MKLEKNQAFKLILDFYAFPCGYWKKKILKGSIEEIFIEMGFADLDEERGDIYRVNEAGEKELRPHIDEIVSDFIGYAKNNSISLYTIKCSEESAAIWINEKYTLNDIEMAKNLLFYISKILPMYGYKAGQEWNRDSMDQSERSIVYCIDQIK